MAAALLWEVRHKECTNSQSNCFSREFYRTTGIGTKAVVMESETELSYAQLWKVKLSKAYFLWTLNFFKTTSSKEYKLPRS